MIVLLVDTYEARGSPILRLLTDTEWGKRSAGFGRRNGATEIKLFLTN